MRRLAAVALAVIVALSPSTALAHDDLSHRINTFRERHDRHALRLSPTMHDIARARARAIYRDFDHDLSWIDSTRCVMGGEIIAFRRPAPARPARWAFRKWRASDEHRRVMLMRRWDRIGSHVYLAPDGGAYAVAVFCDDG